MNHVREEVSSPTRRSVSPHCSRSPTRSVSPVSSPTRSSEGRFVPPESPTSVLEFPPREESPKQSDAGETHAAYCLYACEDDDAFFSYKEDEDDDDEVAELTLNARRPVIRDIDIPGLEHDSMNEGLRGLDDDSGFRRIPPKDEAFISFNEEEEKLLRKTKSEEDELVGLAFLGE